MRTLLLFATFILFFSCKKETVAIKEIQPAEAISESLNVTAQDSLKSPIAQSPILKEYRYSMDLCDYVGWYDPKKITEAQIEGALSLWLGTHTSISSPMVFTRESLLKFREETPDFLEKINLEYKESKKHLETLPLPDNKYWRRVRKTDLRTTEEVFDMYRTEAMALTNPAALKTSKFSKKCEKFVTALNSDDAALLKIWEDYVEIQAKKNSDPERILAEFQEESNSPDFRDYAVVDLITFGWGNCANAQIDRAERDLEMIKEFEKLFTKVETVYCEEP